MGEDYLRKRGNELGLVGRRGCVGNVVVVVLSTFFFTYVGIDIHLTNSLPSIRGDFFQGLITTIFTTIVLYGGHAIPGISGGC